MEIRSQPAPHSAGPELALSPTQCHDPSDWLWPRPLQPIQARSYGIHQCQVDLAAAAPIRCSAQPKMCKFRRHGLGAASRGCGWMLHMLRPRCG